MNGFMMPQKGHRAEGGGDKQNWSFVECEKIEKFIVRQRT